MFRNVNITFKTAHSKPLRFTGLIMIHYLVIQLSAPPPQQYKYTQVRLSGESLTNCVALLWF
jgi:hypothetical protein